MAGRARDVLRAQDADEVAASLDIADRFELARALSGAARSVAFAAEVGLRQARNALPRRGLAALRRPPVRRPLDSGVVEHAGEVALARDATAARDPALVLRVAATAARTGLPVAAGTLHRLADTAPELREPWPRAALGELLSLLGTGRPMVDVVESLDRTGLWGRLFPEWGAVRDLPPRDRAHVWTVDRHLVEACAQAARLTTQVARPDLLLVGALLHDIGKGRGGDHSVVGESLAVQVGRRLGFRRAGRRGARRGGAPPPAAAAHRHPPRPGGPGDGRARRRDPRAGRPRRGALLLDLLGALAEADSLATGPGVWSPWKRVLIGDLVARCRALLAGEALPAPAEPSAAEIEHGRDGGGGGTPAAAPGAGAIRPRSPSPSRRPDRRARRGRGGARTALVGGARRRACCPRPRRAPPRRCSRFTVTPRFGGFPDPALLRSDLARVLDGSLALDEALARKERDYAPRGVGGEPPAPARVLWFDDEATGAVVMELRGTDRIGLLHRVAAALAGCDVGLRWARVSTLGASVVDAFCLDTGDGTVAAPAAARGGAGGARRGAVARVNDARRRR